MLKIITTATERANDTADHQPPVWHPGTDGARIVVMELHDVPNGETTGIPICQVACRYEYRNRVGDALLKIV